MRVYLFFKYKILFFVCFLSDVVSCTRCECLGWNFNSLVFSPGLRVAEDILVARLHFKDKISKVADILCKTEVGMDRHLVGEEEASVVGSVTGALASLCLFTPRPS